MKTNNNVTVKHIWTGGGGIITLKDGNNTFKNSMISK